MQRLFCALVLTILTTPACTITVQSPAPEVTSETDTDDEVDPCVVMYDRCLAETANNEACAEDLDACYEPGGTGGEEPDATTGDSPFCIECKGTTGMPDLPDETSTTGTSTGGEETSDGSDGSSSTGEPEPEGPQAGDPCDPVNAPCESPELRCEFIEDAWTCTFDTYPDVDFGEGEDCAASSHMCKDGLFCTSLTCAKACYTDINCSEGQVCDFPDGAFVGFCESAP